MSELLALALATGGTVYEARRSACAEKQKACQRRCKTPHSAPGWKTPHCALATRKKNALEAANRRKLPKTACGNSSSRDHHSQNYQILSLLLQTRPLKYVFPVRENAFTFAFSCPIAARLACWLPWLGFASHLNRSISCTLHQQVQASVSTSFCRAPPFRQKMRSSVDGFFILFICHAPFEQHGD